LDAVEILRENMARWMPLKYCANAIYIACGSFAPFFKTGFMYEGMQQEGFEFFSNFQLTQRRRRRQPDWKQTA
jgi:hypothetical protein